MQPFKSSRTPEIEDEDASWLSTAKSPNSFFRSASLYVGFLERSWGRRLRRRVVLPEPRKPVMIVIGMGDMMKEKEGMVVVAGESHKNL
jgi:hypothetical protein